MGQYLINRAFWIILVMRKYSIERFSNSELANSCSRLNVVSLAERELASD